MAHPNFKEQVKAALGHNFQTREPVMIISEGSLGRTAAVKEFADSKGMRLYACLTPYVSSEDLQGLPRKIEATKIEKRDENENCILLFDNIDRASREVLDALKGAIEEGRLGGVKLPRGCLIVMTAIGDKVGEVTFGDPREVICGLMENEATVDKLCA